MPVSIPDLSQSLATLLAGDLDALDVDIASPATPPPVDWGEQVRGSVQGLIQRVNGEVQARPGSEVYPRVVASVDYTALATATPTLGQVVSYGGISHVWQLNTGGTQLSTADVLLATGLRLRYKTSGAGTLDISDSVDTSGGVYFELGSIPSYSEMHRYMVMWHFTPAAGASWDSGDSIRFYLKTPAGAGASRWEGVTGYGRGCQVGYNSLASVMPCYNVSNGATQGGSRTEITPTAGGTTGAPLGYNVIALRPDPSGDKMSVFAGVWASGWPTLASMIRIGSTDALATGNGNHSPCNLAVTRVGVWLSGPAGAASPHGADLHHMQVVDLGMAA